MAERINSRSHNNLKPWERLGLAATTVALGVAAIAGCGNEKAGASHSPDRPTASASATPGSSESSQAPSETTSTSPEQSVILEMKETVLANSEVYNNMSAADQAMVEKDKNLSLEAFEKLPAQERAMVSLALSDAQHESWIKAVGPIVMPGNQGQPLNAMLTMYEDPKTKKISKKIGNRAEDMYDYAVSNDTPKDIDTWTNFQPYFGVQMRRAVATLMAATGKPSLLEDAKKIVVGTLSSNEEDMNESNAGNLPVRISQLEAAASTKTDTLKYLGYPDAATYENFLTKEMSGPWVGYPGTVTTSFKEVDPTNPIDVEPGLNSDGATAAAYDLIKYTDKNGHQKAIWTEFMTSTQPRNGLADPHLGVLVLNKLPDMASESPSN